MFLSGGISYGDVEEVNSVSLQNGKICHTSHLQGKAVVNALRLGTEAKSRKGSHIYCDKDFVSLLESPKDFYLEPLPDTDLFEASWTANIFKRSHAKGCVPDWLRIWLPYLVLYSCSDYSHNSLPLINEHSLEMMKIMIKSAYLVMRKQETEVDAKAIINRYLADLGVNEISLT